MERSAALQCSFVPVFYCEKGKGTHPPAQCARKFFSRYAGLLMVMRKNRPMVPRHFFFWLENSVQEPPPGSAAKHCWFLDTRVAGGGRVTSLREQRGSMKIKFFL